MTPHLVPLVVVTGFLGAGKTTLINRLLARRRERGDSGGGNKLAVIVNELGEVGIDGELLGGDAARQIELPGGCVCCVLGDELGTTLIELVDRNPALEVIVLETTGVAEPLAIAWAVEREPVASCVRLAAIVTLIDASNFLTSRQVSTSVDEQVANADVLLVTKAELVGNLETLTQVQATARELAPAALQRRGDIDGHVTWLETLLADPVLPEQMISSSDRQVRNGLRDHHEHVHDDHCRDDDSHAAHGIDSVWVPVDAPVDLEELADQLAALPPNYVRIKGIMRAKPDEDSSGQAPRWMAIHRVGPRVSSEPLDALQPQQARLVALGPAVSREALAQCVANSIA